MTARHALDVLHRLNDLQLMERRVEASERRQAVTRSAELCDRQDGFLEYLGERLRGAIPERWVAKDYQMESDRFEGALRDRAGLSTRLIRDEASLEQAIQECFSLERRNKTLMQVLATRLAETRRVEEQRRLRELDELWSQGRRQA